MSVSMQYLTDPHKRYKHNTFIRKRLLCSLLAVNNNNNMPDHKTLLLQKFDRFQNRTACRGYIFNHEYSAVFDEIPYNLPFCSVFLGFFPDYYKRQICFQRYSHSYRNAAKRNTSDIISFNYALLYRNFMGYLFQNTGRCACFFNVDIIFAFLSGCKSKISEFNCPAFFKGISK